MEVYFWVSLVLFLAGFNQGLFGFGVILIAISFLTPFLNIKTVIPLTALTALSIAIMLFIQMRMAEWGAGMGPVHAKQLILNEMMPKIVRIFGLCWPF